MKLLMLNDEVLTAEVMKDELDWKRCEIDEVELAFNVEQAKEKLCSGNFDIALCDIEMPGENGIDLLRWIRGVKMDIEVIFLTCHASFQYAQEAVKLGCQDYILIPARYEEIAESIHKVVLRRRKYKDDEKIKSYGEQWIRQQKDQASDVQGDRKTPQEIVQESVNFIMQQLGSEELTVNEVANHCYLNPTYLNRIFKKEKGISISQFIISEKMELAARLLKDSNLTAQVVAWKVGYPSYPHFSTTFKKHFGISPTNYKESKSVSEG